MSRAERLVDRRWFLATSTRSALAVALFGVACTSDTPSGPAASASRDGGAAPTTDRPANSSSEADDTAAPAAALRWERANLGFVSAYVLVRAGEAAVVDTGVAGSADQIEATLEVAGVTWGDVGHVILTHKHPDHVGSVEEVLARAPGAAVHAGAEDVSAVPVDGVQSLGDGDRVFELTVVATPGHTPGHVCVHDPMTRLLVAGDALNGNADGTAVTGPNPQFTPDMATAIESVARLAELDVATVLFGHGAPFAGDASAAIEAVAAGA